MSGKYRISFTPAVEQSDGTYTEEFGNLETAKAVSNSIANYTLHLHETSLMPDYSNCGWVDVFEDGEWLEIEEDTA